MRLCEFCHYALPKGASDQKRFCDNQCHLSFTRGEYSPPLVPLSKRHHDPVWGPLADILWGDKR